MSLSHAARAEVTKQFTTSGWWILAIVLFAYVGATASGLAFVIGGSASGALGDQTGMPAPDEGMAPLLYGLAASIGYVFPLLIGTLMVTVEFRHKTLTPTFLATPKRGIVLSAKMLVGAGVGVLFGLISLVATVGPAAAILAGFGVNTELGSGDTWALMGRTLIAFALWTLIGIGAGALIRNQVAAIVAVLAFTQFIEPVARVAGGFLDGLSDVVKFLPGAASDALVGSSIMSIGTSGGEGSLEWWQGGIVLFSYAVVFVLLGNVTNWRRDVD